MKQMTNRKYLFKKKKWKLSLKRQNDNEITNKKQSMYFTSDH